MLEKLVDDPGLQQHLRQYERGQTLFIEGDSSEELYVLRTGQVEVVKGDKVIASIDQRGAVFGEMSFLLGGRRTATLRAASHATALKIPRGEIQERIHDHPELAQEMARVVALRLDQASQVMLGLRELSDQLPEAVVIADEKTLVLSANRAARQLFGLGWSELRGSVLPELFVSPALVAGHIRRAMAGEEVSEAGAEMEHPQKGLRQLSFSMNQLIDARHKPQGVVVVVRDVTHTHNLRRRFRSTLMWALPLFLVLAGVAGYLAWQTTQYTGHVRTLSEEKQTLRNQMARDFFMLEPMLLENLSQGEKKLKGVLRRFAEVQSEAGAPYVGVLMVGEDNRVLAAQGIKEGVDLSHLEGTSYGRLRLGGGEGRLHSVLEVHRVDPESGLSRGSVEMAFELSSAGKLKGWLVLQMDVDRLTAEGMTVQDLKDLRFHRPRRAQPGGGEETG